MSLELNLNPIYRFFGEKFASHGPTPAGLDWPSQIAMEIRFEQILKICDASIPFSIIDYGCGYGALIEMLDRWNMHYDYYGFDIVEAMIEQANREFTQYPYCHFTTDLSTLPVCDYVVESGVFNIRLDTSDHTWTAHILDTLHLFDRLSCKGFAFNMLTRYSDEEYIEKRPELYYGDPCFFFDYCKKHFSRNVALLHDYEIYDFTILVRKGQS